MKSNASIPVTKKGQLMDDQKSRVKRLLEYIGNEVWECEGCGYINELYEVSHGEDGITVCPECRSIESFEPLGDN